MRKWKNRCYFKEKRSAGDCEDGLAQKAASSRKCLRSKDGQRISTMILNKRIFYNSLSTVDIVKKSEEMSGQEHKAKPNGCDFRSLRQHVNHQYNHLGKGLLWEIFVKHHITDVLHSLMHSKCFTVHKRSLALVVSSSSISACGLEGFLDGPSHSGNMYWLNL